MSNFAKLTPDAYHADRAVDHNRAFQTIAAALDRLSFGSIQLTVHNGKLVQIDVTERHRDLN